MDEDNLKMTPLLVSPPDSEKQLMDVIKKNKEEINKKEEEIKKIEEKIKKIEDEIKKREDEMKKKELQYLANIKKIYEEIASIEKLQRFLSLLAVLIVSLWALFSAYILGGLSVSNIFGPSLGHQQQQCSESETCYELPCPAADEANAIMYGLLCCSVLQAAAAVLALMPTGNRRRRALAYVALAATTVGHCLYGRFEFLIPGGRLPVSVLVNDLLFLLCLLIIQVADDDLMRTEVIKPASVINQ